MQLSLTVRQRLALEMVIRLKDPSTPFRCLNIDDLVTLNIILKKVELPEEERKAYVRALPGGQSLLDLDAMKKAEPLVVDLERADAAKLRTRLEEWFKDTGGITVDDLDWYVPLHDALEAGSKYKTAQ